METRETIDKYWIWFSLPVFVLCIEAAAVNVCSILYKKFCNQFRCQESIQWKLFFWSKPNHFQNFYRNSFALNSKLQINDSFRIIFFIFIKYLVEYFIVDDHERASHFNSPPLLDISSVCAYETETVILRWMKYSKKLYFIFSSCHVWDVQLVRSNWIWRVSSLRSIHMRAVLP